jgi:mRNA interferase HigB
MCSRRENIFVENDHGVIKRMELIHFDVVEKSAKKHARSRSSLNMWRKTAIEARWTNFDEVKKTFRATDFYGDCVIFDVGGNNYRLIAKINYEYELVSIKAVMTHAEYDKDKWKKNC